MRWQPRPRVSEAERPWQCGGCVPSLLSPETTCTLSTPPPPIAGPCNGTISHQAKTIVRNKRSLGPSRMDLLGFHSGGRADLGESWEDCCLSFALQAFISAPYISVLLPIQSTAPSSFHVDILGSLTVWLNFLTLTSKQKENPKKVLLLLQAHMGEATNESFVHKVLSLTMT